jgi:hypothetical protein
LIAAHAAAGDEIRFEKISYPPLFARPCVRHREASVAFEYTIDFDDYLNEIIDNQEIDTGLRLKAAFEVGTINGLKTAGRLSTVLQIHSADKLAMAHPCPHSNTAAATPQAVSAHPS